MKIGFFDSGLGGLILLKAVAKALPDYDYYYYGDTAHVPYGDKSEEEIFRLSQLAMEYLFAQGCLIVVIACNTASAETLRKLQDDYLPNAYPDRRILGVIIPTIEELNRSGSHETLLMATKRTVESKKYEKELQLKGNKEITLRSVATPQLVPLIEQGELEAAANEAIHVVEDRYPGKGEAVILGCTHYTLLKDSLRKKFPELTFISQDEVIPEKLNDYLTRHPELESKLTRGGGRQIHLTAHRPDYDAVMSQLLGGVYIDEAS